MQAAKRLVSRMKQDMIKRAIDRNGNRSSLILLQSLPQSKRQHGIGFGFGLRLGFGGIENPIREQFHAIIHEEPRQSITPDEQLPNPNQGVS